MSRRLWSVHPGWTTLGPMDRAAPPPPMAPPAIPREATLALGGFDVRRDGGLTPGRRDRPAALHFAWRGRPCTAVLGGEGLGLSAEAGRVPFTVEAPAARRAALAALADLPAALPPGWRLALRPDHGVRLHAAAAMDLPATAPALVAALVRFALALDPYLERLESSGLGPASGTPSTCPG